jgi:hypothetical protein
MRRDTVDIERLSSSKKAAVNLYEDSRAHPYSRRVRSKLRLVGLYHLDRRTSAARRADRLIAAFKADLGGDVTPTILTQIERAAVLTAVAEDARARRLAGDLTITLDDLVRVDRLAAAATRALGIGQKRVPVHVPLRERLARGLS